MALKAIAADDPNWKFTVPYRFETIGKTAVDVAVKIALGEEVDHDVVIPPQPPVTSANARQVLAGVEAAAALAKESFGSQFREGGAEGSANGLRTLGARRATDKGTTEAETEAPCGGMASLYTRAAGRKNPALGAATKTVPEERNRKSRSRTSPKGAGGSTEN